MNFTLTPRQQAVRKEFEDFFREEMTKAPPVAGGENIYDNDDAWAFHCDIARKLGQRGWLSLPWPKQYGGQEAPIIEQLLFNEVRSYYRAPGVDVQGIGMLAPTLLVSGNENQKQQHLPPLARGETTWCQGWSEPNAGSDLASLTTKAVRRGEDYIINGQKTWTSGAHRAHWCFMLARTDPNQPRHRGLSFFLLDMKTPGISLRPLKGMDGSHMFNEMFFDDVRVPASNLVGEENRGWYVSLMTMNFERSSVGAMSEARRVVEELVQFCKESMFDGRPLSEDRLVRNLLGQITIEIDVGKALSYRVAALQEKGQENALEAAIAASAAKLYGSELGQRLAYTGCRVMGLYGQVKGGSRWAPLRGYFESAYQQCLGMNIAAGTSEIQRNVIAVRGLDLPREPAPAKN
ncbi:MAG: acyl-CoA dehydrogenase family protein [Dehalococcoidia bacterium]|nr:acyl-CoA dehydrogenase family protein [Dehalococcoidia bacterium]